MNLGIWIVTSWILTLGNSQEMQKKQRFRLSGELKPLVYDLKLTLTDIREEIDGQVKIKVICQKTTGIIELHANPQFVLIYHGFLEKKDSNDTLKLKKTVVNQEKQRASYVLPENLEKGQIYFLNFWFVTRYSTEFKGFSQVFDSNHGIWMNSLFETSHARELMPCFDEPGLRAVFKLQVWLKNGFANKDYVALSNTHGERQFWNEALSIWNFEPTPPIPTYLLTLAIGKFKSLCNFKTEINREICIWRFQDWTDWEEIGILIIETMAKFQKIMLDQLGIDPMAKLHLLVVPSKLNGMENYGLLNIREALWPISNDTKNFYTFRKTLFHEMAHQWFGNLVTMAWWKDIWLSESLTTFISTPRPVLVDINTDLSTDPLVSDLWATNIPQISYYKGAAILSMLENLIGKQKLLNIFRKYLKTFQFEAATTDDFLKILQNETQEFDFDAEEFFRSWLTKGSHPIVFIDYDSSMKKFVLSQVPKMGLSNIRWPVPIWISCLRGTKNEALFWLRDDKQLVIDLKDVTDENNKHAVGFNKNRPVYYQLSYRFKKRRTRNFGSTSDKSDFYNWLFET